MPVELEMPELAESVIEGEIVKWLVKEGDHVELDQLIVEVMTDKVTVEVPSPYEGVLLKQVAKEGDVVPIGKPIAIFGKVGETLEGEHAAPAAAAAAASSAPTASAPATPAPTAPAPSKPEEKPAAATSGNGQMAAVDRKDKPPQETSEKAPAAKETSEKAAAAKAPAEEAAVSAFGRPTAAPAVRRLARELGVDLLHVKGSGDGGRIRSDDVRRVAASMTGSGAGTPAAAPAADRSTVQVDRSVVPAQPAEKSRPAAPAVTGETERVPLRGLRRVIAEHMSHSKQTAVHTLHVDEVDLSELVALRTSAKEKAAERGVKLTYLPFFVRAVCHALKKYPYMNASLDDAAHEIILKKDYNIGIAANTEAGLVVPVVHHADRKTIFELATEISALADKARQGKLGHDDISGGTFTITNVGSVGGLFTFPIINYPEVGILGTHGIQERAVVRNGQIVIRHMMYLSISFDHRVVDGALAATFVKEVADYLSAPGAMLLLEGN
jgi:2-oxoisovalerate dehydrogenase E2 component (dihydrolipoyl transacylase)